MRSLSLCVLLRSVVGREYVEWIPVRFYIQCEKTATTPDMEVSAVFDLLNTATAPDIEISAVFHPCSVLTSTS